MTGDGRRRSPRAALSIPLRVKWTTARGEITEEQTNTETLNGHGARIRLKTPIRIGLEMEIVNLENQESARACVVWASDHSTYDGQRVGIEFLTPRAAFWGLTYAP